MAGRKTTPLQCPVCSRVLGVNERLGIAHDSIGTLIVTHHIPAIGHRHNETDEEWSRMIDDSNLIEDVDLKWIGMQDNCGLAGFTNVEFEGR